MIKVLIADDHPIVRRGLCEIVSEQNRAIVFAEAANGEEMLKKLHSEKPDVLVLDISLPDRNGLDLLQEVKHMQPQLPVLILSMHPEEQYAIRVLKAGAAGYISKESAGEELVHAIQKVAAGSKYISATLAEQLASNLNGNPNQLPHETLSDREYSVLIMIGAGKAVGGIADDLALSVKTVSTYRARVLEKMGLKTNADLIRYVIDNHLL
jgi:two-component system, NarL family, invasion response regulator UvrY